MKAQAINRFRQKRGAILRGKIQSYSIQLGRAIRILDVGGRADYWENVGFDGIEHITLLNYNAAELEREAAEAERTAGSSALFSRQLGDGRDLSDFRRIGRSGPFEFRNRTCR